MTPETENNKKLKAFFSKEYQSLRNYINSRIKATADRDAEDIIQDVALNLFAGADRYAPINNVASFVYRSIKNKLIDSMRTKKQSTDYQDEKEITLLELTELIYGKSDNAYSDEMKETLKQSINELKPAYRNIIVAFDLEGYSYKEISEETGIPVGTLMSHRHRAIAQLYKSLKPVKEIINENKEL